MYTRLTLRNIRSWGEQVFELSPLTVLVGPNASGKTTVLEVLHLLSQLGGPKHPKEVLTRSLDPERFIRDGANDLEAVLEGGSGGESFSVRYKAARGPEAGFYQWVHWTAPGAAYEIHWNSAGSKVGQLPWEDDAQRGRPWLRELRGCAFLHLDVRALQRASYSEDEIPRIEFDGEGLAAALAYMKQERVEEFERIEQGLKAIVPSVSAIRLPRAKVSRSISRHVEVDNVKASLPGKQEYMGNRVVFDMGAASNVRASQAGEGTLLALGLISALSGPNHPRHALVDDIDMRLHPKAQGELMKLIREMMGDQNASEQFVGTTHSPYFLQHVSADEVIVVDLSGDRSTAGRLSNHPEYDKWKDVMGVGEFWSFAGEAWLRKG